MGHRVARLTFVESWTGRRLVALGALTVAIASAGIDLYLASRDTCHVAHYWLPAIFAPPILLPTAAALVGPWRNHFPRAAALTFVALVIGVQIFLRIDDLGATHC